MYKRQIRYGAGILYEACLACPDPVIRTYLIKLLLMEDSWKRLPFLLRLYQTEDLELREMIHKRVDKRNPYAVLGRTEETLIRQALEETADQLPRDLIQGIELDLRHLAKR